MDSQHPQKRLDHFSISILPPAFWAGAVNPWGHSPRTDFQRVKKGSDLLCVPTHSLTNLGHPGFLRAVLLGFSLVAPQAAWIKVKNLISSPHFSWKRASKQFPWANIHCSKQGSWNEPLEVQAIFYQINHLHSSTFIVVTMVKEITIL